MWNTRGFCVGKINYTTRPIFSHPATISFIEIRSQQDGFPDNWHNSYPALDSVQNIQCIQELLSASKRDNSSAILHS